MNATVMAVARRSSHWLVRATDYVELCKPRIGILVLLTVAVSVLLASWGNPELVVLAHVLVGTGLVVASGCAWNQWLERHVDARMARTATRPLPSGRLTEREVIVFGSFMLLTGLAYLSTMVGLQTTLAALVTWLMYVWIYTPLKSRTPWNTFVGAVAGAMPVVIGWSATGVPLGVRVAALFMIVFLWQFPHFMAIAWLYRRQYEAAGMKMLTVVDATGRRAGIQAVLTALALLPVSILPAIEGPPSLIYLPVAIGLGAIQLFMAVLFCLRRDESNSRRLLRTSLVYLPCMLFILAILPAV